MPDWSRWFYDAMYRFTRPDWDTGLTPPEVVALIENHHSQGRALDLGCGTGTHSIYLAQHGFEVVGVDFSPKAIELAHQKARGIPGAIEFRVGDVTRLDFLHDTFDLVLDVGCFHGLNAADKARYASEVARLTHPRSTLLVYAFTQPTFMGRYGLTVDEARRILAPHFDLARVEHGQGRHQRNTAWYEFKREYNVAQA